MIDLNYISQEDKKFLVEDCKDFLDNLNITLFSDSDDNIILQAIKEGYELENFDAYLWKHK